MRTHRIVIAAFIALMVLFAPTAALAAPPNAPQADDIVIFGQDYTLAAGQTQVGSIIVFGGNVTIETGSTVTDSLIVFGGNVAVDGTIIDSVVVVGGNVHLGANTIIEGDIVTPGGSLTRDPGAQVLGNQVSNMNPRSFGEVHFPTNNLWFTGLGQLLLAGSVTIIALLLTLFFPDHLERVSRAAVSKPLNAGGFGLLSLVLMLIAFVILFITCLVPLALIVLFITGWIFGWTALGLEAGKRLSQMLQVKWTPVFATTLGTFLLSIIAAFLTLGIPAIGFLGGALLGAVGFGAVILTRYGTLQEATPTAPPAKRAVSKRKTAKRTKR